MDVHGKEKKKKERGGGAINMREKEEERVQGEIRDSRARLRVERSVLTTMRGVKARRIVEERERLLLTDQFELKLLGQKMRILKEERDLWKVKTMEEVKESLIISMDEEVADVAGISQLDTPGREW